MTDPTRDSANTRIAKTLVESVLKLINEQKKLGAQITNLIQRIDTLTTMVMNARPDRFSQPMSKREMAVTGIAVVVFAILALVLILQCSVGCSSDQPVDFIVDDDDSVDTVDTVGELDAGTDGSDGDADGDVDGDVDGDTDGDTDTDIDSDGDTDTDTTVFCPWECKTPTNPGWMTCDDFEITDSDVPEMVRNYNFECEDPALWCCQPWPPDSDDELAIHDLCLDEPNHRCDLTCSGEINPNKACYHAQTVCCGLRGSYGNTKRKTRNKGLASTSGVPAPRGRSIRYRLH